MAITNQFTKMILVALLTITSSQASDFCTQLNEVTQDEYVGIFSVREVEALNFQEEVAKPLFSETLMGKSPVVEIIGEFDKESCEDALTQDQITLNGKTYNMIYTIEDYCDGGNSYGYISDLSGSVVATIKDTDIYCEEL